MSVTSSVGYNSFDGSIIILKSKYLASVYVMGAFIYFIYVHQWFLQFMYNVGKYSVLCRFQV
jgi:hypothetical protein